MKHYSTRSVVLIACVAISLFCSTGITIFFNSSMTDMLKQREKDQIETFLSQAQTLLQRDGLFLSIVLKDWATKRETYEFVEQRTPFDRTKYLDIYPMVLLRLNYASIVAANGFLSERHFDHINERERETSPHAGALREISLWQHRQVMNKARDVSSVFNIFYALDHSQISGLINVDDAVYYVSTVPILPSLQRDKGPNGTMTFAREITKAELNRSALSKLETRDGPFELSFTPAAAAAQADIGLDGALYSPDGKTIILSSRQPTIDGRDIFLTASRPRDLYRKGVAIIEKLTFLVFLFSCGMSAALVLTVETWLLRPVTELSRKVAEINYNGPAADLPEFRARELNVLSSRIGELLLRIDDHKQYIEAQNATLSEQNRQLNHLANYDPLTRLPNKNLFRSIIDRAIAKSIGTKQVVAAIYMNVINFRLINDARGHAVGDQVLIAISNRLTSMFEIDGENAVAAFGMDNFAIMLTARDKEDVMMSAYTLMSIFNDPFVIENHEINVSVNAGISVYPYDGDSFDELDACAGIALNNIKEAHSSSFIFFSHSQLEDVIKRYNRAEEIKRGLERGEFRVVFQPKLDVRTNRIHSSEALVRWHSPYGPIPPSSFIPDACRTGLIVPLTWEIMRLTIAHNVRFMRQLGEELSVGINVPNNVLLHSDFIPTLTGLLESSGMPPVNLNVELTEDVLVNDMEMCTDRMLSLQKIGAQISLDDFGTGYSSLQYLSRMPFDWMKIDKAFVDGVPDKPEEMAIIAASVGIARGLGMKVVLEGVETPRQWETITAEHYCDEIQGYVVSKPLEPDDFVSFVSEWNTYGGYIRQSNIDRCRA